MIDWMTNAAEEISKIWPTERHGRGDGYLTDEQRASIAQDLRKVIARHCPLPSSRRRSVLARRFSADEHLRRLRLRPVGDQIVTGFLALARALDRCGEAVELFLRELGWTRYVQATGRSALSEAIKPW